MMAKPQVPSTISYSRPWIYIELNISICEELEKFIRGINVSYCDLRMKLIDFDNNKRENPMFFLFTLLNALGRCFFSYV